MVKFRVDDQNVDSILAFQRVANHFDKPLRVYTVKGKGGKKELIVRTSGLRARIADLFTRSSRKKQTAVTSSSGENEKYKAIFEQARQPKNEEYTENDFKQSYALAPRETLAMLRKSNSDFSNVITACSLIVDKAIATRAYKKELEQILFSTTITKQYLASDDPLKKQYEELATKVNPDKAKIIMDQRGKRDLEQQYQNLTGTAQTPEMKLAAFKEMFLFGDIEQAEKLKDKHQISKESLVEFREEIKKKIGNIEHALQSKSSEQDKETVKELNERKFQLEQKSAMLQRWTE